MIVIFKFSNEPGSISQQKSVIVIDIMNCIGFDISASLEHLINLIVRKSAHFIEYFILSFLISNALLEDFSFYDAIILSLLITFLYAVFDELHQFFVPGRACKFTDVIIDTSGGSLYLIIKMMFNKQKQL